ncbi:aldo/keto reductase [Streptomyces sp. E-08]|uniref:aldo/keto reductase n=1 Tax=Streptomyces sp. E-08 TaxID=3404047 RepID=UPI003CEF7960
MTHPTLTIGGDLTVGRLGFGAMRITGPQVWGPPADVPGALKLVRRAVELGITFIDTADSYGPGVSEELLAEAIHPYPEGVVIATKAGQSRPSAAEWQPLGRPEYLRQQAELSLRRLRLDRIDLFQLHRIDPLVPLADQLGALKRLQDEGKIRHIGLSQVSVAQLEEARRHVEVVSVQNLYNLSRREDDDVLDYCEREGLAFIPWLPIDRGAHAAAEGPLAEVAAELGATPAQVSLAWLLHRSPAVLPIPGTSSPVHLEENTAAARLELTAEQFARLAGTGSEAA